MAKKTIKRYIPSPGKLREIKSLQVLGDWIYQPNLWHINRHSASTGFFVGFFCAFIPLPTQMVFAAFMSVWLRCNLPLAVGLCWITNPLTMAPIFFLAYKVGAVALGVTPETIQFELSWDWITHGLVAIWQPFLLGCLLCGLFFGCLGYFVVNTLWRWGAVRRWEARSIRRRARIKKAIHDVELRQEEISQHDAQDTTPPGKTSPPSPGQ
jgi:uncharacterized protein (DUF2062 family)